MSIITIISTLSQDVVNTVTEVTNTVTAATTDVVVEATSQDSSQQIIRMVLDAGPMVKGVMLLLLVFSIFSWAIILGKYIQISKARRNSAKFLDSFWNSRSLGTLYADSGGSYGSSPLAQIFRVGYQELGRVHKARLDHRAAMDNVQRSLRRAGTTESTKLGKYLPFLATCGNAAPFIGLFGTVWGIMSSFNEIGLKGAANLATVAPGISEALIATAAGLAAAIPAVVFYNHYNSKIRVLEAEMGNFMNDFVNILERDLLKRSNKPEEAKV